LIFIKLFQEWGEESAKLDEKIDSVIENSMNFLPSQITPRDYLKKKQKDLYFF
jgi:hypothetical protein